ncbi:hypothetical protein IZ6_22290 [Terrihabitans soli]|uniref:VWFA domain-containing protein n=1 Tax=Terrihabitans soli TaxID=708113 RepID=A0A6S6QM39_9HYPH|nr:VWA domain-containing protein [Terrihabitans soli]BCJ91494.1 hypothetical protein IZ6_22290 [Terrihabitans soli]
MGDASPQNWDRTRSRLSPYLRSLWNIAPVLLQTPAVNAPPRTFLSPLGMHLPNLSAQPHGQDWYEAAAAHAAAHLVFSNHRFDVSGLSPITQALLGLFEDARIEYLAARELPGLRRLWLRFHETPDLPEPTFEGLMQRLAHALLDPSYKDPHPWVQKGVRLFFLDEAGEVLALRQPDELRHAASLLGNDIGQSRMQFNPRAYAVVPAYRDDNSFLWEANDKQPEAPMDVEAAYDDAAAFAPPPPQEMPIDDAATEAVVKRYREWDRLVPAYRPDWCAVNDRPAMRAGVKVDDAAEHADLLQRLHDAVRLDVPAPHRVRLKRQPDGDEFDLDALIEAVTDRRLGHAADPRIHQRLSTSRTAPSTLLLLDTSASTAKAADGGRSVLALTRLSALLCGMALERAGRRHAIHAFSSDGRHAVHYERVKHFDQAMDEASVGRLMGLQSRFSTRLGAALRHATLLLSAQPGPRRLVLITDGEPHDVDVHDPKYLIEDARQAVREGARRDVAMFCINLSRAAEKQARTIFGRPAVHTLSDLEALPVALTRAALRGR